MSNSVNTTIVVVRSGQATVRNFPKLPYVVFVAVQAAAVGALAGTISWGILKSAEGSGVPKISAGGHVDLSFSLSTDHGGGGTSVTSMAYTGISEADADELAATLVGAVDMVLTKAGISLPDGNKQK